MSDKISIMQAAFRLLFVCACFLNGNLLSAAGTFSSDTLEAKEVGTLPWIDGVGDDASWGDRTTPDYAGHFPEFEVSRADRNFTWEFSMQVHNDSYDHTNQDASLVISCLIH